MSYSFGIMASRLPMVAILVIGMILVYMRRSRHTGAAVGLGMAGLGLLLVSTLSTVLGLMYRAELADLNSSLINTGQVVSLIAAASWIGNLVGFGLIIAALVSSLTSAQARANESSPSAND